MSNVPEKLERMCGVEWVLIDNRQEGFNIGVSPNRH